MLVVLFLAELSLNLLFIVTYLSGHGVDGAVAKGSIMASLP
jgi:hypothetical protein